MISCVLERQTQKELVTCLINTDEKKPEIKFQFLPLFVTTVDTQCLIIKLKLSHFLS